MSSNNSFSILLPLAFQDDDLRLRCVTAVAYYSRLGQKPPSPVHGCFNDASQLLSLLFEVVLGQYGCKIQDPLLRQHTLDELCNQQVAVSPGEHYGLTLSTSPDV